MCLALSQLTPRYYTIIFLGGEWAKIDFTPGQPGLKARNRCPFREKIEQECWYVRLPCSLKRWNPHVQSISLACRG